jgi:hypothetical protein
MNTLLQPGGTFHSPFTGQDIDAHLVRREVAANLAVKIYVLGLLGLPEPEWHLTQNGLSYQTAEPPIVGTIPYPPELAEYIAEGFMVEHVMAREHLGLRNAALEDVMPPPPVSGERRGSILRHFNAVDNFLQFATSGLTLDEDHILAIHGSTDLELPGKLRAAGIFHILVWQEEHLTAENVSPETLRSFSGTGTMQLVTLDEAATLARDAYARRPDRIQEILHLQEEWEFDSWSGFHPMFFQPEQPTTPSEQLFNEACGNFELGLLDEAEKQLVEYEGISGSDHRVIRLKKAIAEKRGDSTARAELAKENFEDSRCPLDDLHAVNAAGDPAWAYAKCLETRGLELDPLYWFNRACFASQVGEFRDATASLLRSFRISAKFYGDAFLDPDLEPLWPWMQNATLDDTLAELLANWVWPAAVQVAEASEKELTITPLMRDRVPEIFRQYLPCGTLANGLNFDPSTPSDVFNDYLAWQKEAIAPHIHMLEEAHQRAERFLCKRQLRFAFWQAKHANPTAARYHILHYLAKFPERLPRLNFLRKYGMGYLLDDIAPAITEDGQFVKKMELAHQIGDFECFQKILDEIGPVGRQSTIFKFRAAHCAIEEGQTGDGIRLLTEVIRAWPDDAAAYFRLTDAFVSIKRWEEARVSLGAAPSHARQFWRFLNHWHQIEEEKKEPKGKEGPSCENFFGQRNLGERLRAGHFLSEDTTQGICESTR